MKYPCPSCGYLQFDEQPGSYEICKICFWEDDVAQLRFPKTTGGANKVSLVEAQKNYQALGAGEARFVDSVRKPTDADRRDPLWRPIDLERDALEEPIPGADYGNTYEKDKTKYYYWRQ